MKKLTKRHSNKSNITMRDDKFIKLTLLFILTIIIAIVAVIVYVSLVYEEKDTFIPEPIKIENNEKNTFEDNPVLHIEEKTIDKDGEEYYGQDIIHTTQQEVLLNVPTGSDPVGTTFIVETTTNNGQPELYYTTLEGDYDTNLYWLSRAINAEVGSDYCSDELQLLTGSVVLNRVKSANYPNTIYDVLHQQGQYQCVINGSINKEPTERCIANAKYLLENGPVDSNIIFQAEFEQGSTVSKVIDIMYNDTYITSMYFCY